MDWQDFTVSEDGTHFLFNGKPAFDKKFIEVLKFHAPGLAPVKDETGSYHIDISGNELYRERYSRTFGYYCNRAAVTMDGDCYHINERGERVNLESYSWVGNFQENLCPVRDQANNYFHIDLNGNRVYSVSYTYCGDFKDGYACVRTLDGLYRHIDRTGAFLYDREFLDLGVFHKNFATAKDKDGWFHMDKKGQELYSNRFLSVEPFYNGYALVDNLSSKKIIIDAEGNIGIILS
jgi:hypothetical protein